MSKRVEVHLRITAVCRTDRPDIKERMAEIVAETEARLNQDMSEISGVSSLYTETVGG